MGYSGMCSRCHGGMKLVFGLLLLLNAYVWPRWMGIDGWIAWIAVIMVVAGIAKMIKPTCGHCCEEPVKKKK